MDTKNSTGFVRLRISNAKELAERAISNIQKERKEIEKKLEEKQYEYWRKPKGLMWVLRLGKSYDYDKTQKIIKENVAHPGWNFFDDLYSDPKKNASSYYDNSYKTFQTINNIQEASLRENWVELSLDTYERLLNWQ